MEKVDVLVVGGGGREHALAWRLKQSPRIGKLYIAPGNGGTQLVGENVPIGALEFDALADFATDKQIGLTVVGPDDAFVGGIVDVFAARGLRIWGPTKAAAQIEGSKAFSKMLMREAGIPTAEFGVFTEYEKALQYAREKGVPIVIKASGLALGKGVYICSTLEEAETSLRQIMLDKQFGASGSEVVIEEFLDGPEVSIHAISDGTTYKLFPPTQDHKRALENDEGKNTGGMGVIGPLPFISDSDMRGIDQQIVQPTFTAMKNKSAVFSGLLYPGLKMTSHGPKVLEYNARFGDPETQVYMRLLKTDMLDIFEACVDGTLAEQSIEWNEGFACNIVLASQGYPDTYQKGFPITGIEEAEKMPGVVVFHAGTKIEHGTLLTNGGRVLGVSAVGDTLKEALDHAYAAAGEIHFEGKYLRRDIGAKAL
jgi:phosphoribosylamine--glycine ligase